MPNGFYMIRCSSEQMLEEVLTEGHRSVNGMIIHLIKWKPNFQPAFEELSIATLWIHLHSLPSEYQDLESLEIVASKFGKMVKIDETTMIANRGSFARVCIEMDLSQPLKRGVWVRSSSGNMFVTIAYEKLPMFCFRCGIIGHQFEACKADQSGRRPGTGGTRSQEPGPKEKGKEVEEATGPARNTPAPLEETQEDPRVDETDEDT
ncbi:hypothetical protein J5N97_016942 [Dioscorea zingiberensis]|uniref:CCHC-type domain-containing protein n=1 Tax=Dioscorea zingiberensis TaxID=325984 RepID=A0A9D5CKY7_9LILI|nr:hypothetical protein J5N97_016942 [Dioscorea zingiberensis]